MQRLLLTVKHCRPIEGDVCLAPFIPCLPILSTPCCTLCRPDGSTHETNIYFIFRPHAPDKPFLGHACFLEQLRPADVPPGTQVWVTTL